MRFRILSLAFLVIATNIALAFPPKTLASCDPHGSEVDGIWWAGTVKGLSNTPRNVMANVEEYNPFISNGPVTSAWTMMNRGGSQWAQTGWAQLAGNGGRWAFWQWTHNGTWSTDYELPGAIGTLPTYQVVYNPAAGAAASEFIFERNGSVLWRVSPATFVPNQIQANGEIHNKTDQMPGGFNAPVWLDQVKFTIGGAWTDINSPPLVTDNSIHGVAKTNAHLYKIWDDHCAS